jgi:2-keto-3-deoxy-L-rhamnonate aldolase RhmA
MPLYGSEALERIREGKLALGLGVHHLRGSAVPLLAKAAGYDWLFIDAEHGAISTPEIAQIAMAALPMGVVPIVRICTRALDEGTRALDNGALGIVVPHVDTPEQARGLVEAFRFSPIGHRSTGGSNACFGYRPPSAAEAQKTLNAEILVVAMIETPRAVENAKAIAAIEGIDVLLIGSNDLSLEMGIPGQVGHSTARSWAWVAFTTRRWRAAISGSARAWFWAPAITACCWRRPRGVPSSCARWRRMGRLDAARGRHLLRSPGGNALD